MTTTTIPTNTAAVSGARTSFSDTVRSFWKTMKYRNQQRQSVRNLRSLSDHQLRDVGIHRSEITSVVYGSDADRVRKHELGATSMQAHPRV